MENNNSSVQNVQIIFTDIVKYSLRNTKQQEKVIQIFTSLCSQGIDLVLKKYCDQNKQSLEELKKDIILIPTGDGIAIGYIYHDFVEFHLSIVNQLASLISEYNSSIQCDTFIEKGWCHCHAGFYIRYGISEGKAIIYTDINGNKNIAGTPINEAVRVMGLADGKQVIFSETAYKTLEDLSETSDICDRFVQHRDIEVKHGVKLNVYQYLGIDSTIDKSLPSSIDLQNSNCSNLVRRSYIDFADTASEIALQFSFRKTLDIFKYDTRWVFLFMPSIVLARLNGKRIRILCPILEDEYEKQRVALLVRLGCEVKLFPMQRNISPEMFLFDANTSNFESAIIFGTDNIYSSRPFATFYERGYDKDAINLFFNNFESAWNRFEKILPPNMTFNVVPIENTYIEDRIKHVVYQYAEKGVEVRIEEVQLDSIWFLTTRLYEWKLTQVANILKLYSSVDTALYEPLNIYFDENKFSIITPPIVELHNNKLVVLNGSHRIYYCRKNGITSKVKCIVVRGVKEQLPGVPVRFEKIKIDQTENTSLPRVIDFDFKKFRHIESCIHPYDEVSL